MNVRDAMTTPVITVRGEVPLKDVARKLTEHRISGVPVVGERGEVVGIISEADFVARESGARRERPGAISWLFRDGGERDEPLRKLAGTTAREVMSSPVVTIEADAPLRAAAALMRRRDVNRLPVTERGGLVGILTRADVLKAYLRSDEELERFIRDDVLVGTLWLEPHLVEVSVEQGVVTLRGRLDRRSTAQIAERLAREVDGVIGVKADLEWDLDDRRIEAAARASRGLPEERNWP